MIRSEQDEAVASRLADLGEPGWAVTLLFYAAMHLVQAYLVNRNPPPETHSAREALITRLPILRPLADDYRALKKYSELARYECEVYSIAQFAGLRDGRFRRISSQMRGLLA